MKCLICLKEDLENYCDNSFLNLPVFYCKSCFVHVSGNSEDMMRNNCKEIYQKKFWGNNNLWDAKKIIENDYQDNDSKSKKRTWKSQYAYCKEFLDKDGEILEVGAGQGQASYWFEQAGYNITAIEPDPNNAKLINNKLRNGKCISCDAENISLGKKFSIVWVSHVLEHMVSPQNFIDNINKHLIDNGILFIEVPNCENKKVLKTSIEKVPHTFHYSMRSLQIIMERNNFCIKKSDYFKPASKIDGIQNRLFRKSHPYYPRITSNSIDGKYFRIIAQKKN